MKKEWKWEIRIFVGFLVLSGLVLGIPHWRATQTFRRHEEDVAAKIAAIRASDPARPALLGDGEPGNGWENYARALDAVAAIPEAELNEIPQIRAEPDFVPDRARLDGLFGKYAGSILDEFRRELSKKEFVPPYRYEDGMEMLIPYLAKAMKGAKFLAGGAANLHLKGRDREALEWLVLCLGMAQDTARRGVLIQALVGCVCEGSATCEWKVILAEHSLTAEDLAWAAGVLDRLEKMRPDIVDVLSVEDVTCRRALILSQCSPDALFTYPGAWRYLFSSRLAGASALGYMDKYYQEMEGLRGLPPFQRFSAAEAITRRYDDCVNPFVRLILSALEKFVSSENKTRMDWTLMRVATAIAGYEAEKGAFPASLGDLVPRRLPAVPECPFTGKPLGYAAGKVWSYGPDGDDDGGRPLADDANDIDPASDGDIVWTVKRKGE